MEKVIKPIRLVDDKIQELLIEPTININEFDSNYHFNLSSVEGKWHGEEPVEQLIGMLSK